MSYGEKIQTPGVAGQVAPPLDDDEIAWQFPFYEGRILQTWRAREAYALKPVFPVEPYSIDQYEAPAQGERHLPSIDLLIVHPDELIPAAEAIAPGESVVSETTEYLTVAEQDGDYIRSIMKTGVSLSDDLDTQVNYFIKKFDHSREDLEALLCLPDKFADLAARSLARMARQSAIAGISICRASVLSQLPRDDLSRRTLGQTYPARVGYTLRALFGVF